MTTTDTRKAIDHDEIRRWVESHDGHPAQVRGATVGRGAGLLRLRFPSDDGGNGGDGGDDLEPISWDDWFAKFDEAGLALLYQQRKTDGSECTLTKLVHR
jgi:hypothetical protein